MASILSGNQFPQQQQIANDPANAVNNLVNQVLNSVNPQQTFQQILQQSPEAQNAMQMINQYGNGDPKQAFMNYASQMGKQGLAQQILQKLGLG